MKAVVSIMILLLVASVASWASSKPKKEKVRYRNEGLNEHTDFKAMSADEVTAFLQDADRIKVKGRKTFCNQKRPNSFRKSLEVGCALTPEEGDIQNQQVVLRDMEALFRGCGLFATSKDQTWGDDRSGYTCGMLGSLFFAIGNEPAARAAWDAPGCHSHDMNGNPVNGCMTFIVGHIGIFGPQLGTRLSWEQAALTGETEHAYDSNRPKLITMARQACVRELDGASCLFLQARTDIAVDMNAIQNAKSARYHELRDRVASDIAERQQETREKNARFNAAMDTLRSMPGGSDPNAITDAANQQGAQMVAIGAANDAARHRAAAQRSAQTTPVQEPETVPNPPTNAVSAPGVEASTSQSRTSTNDGASSQSVQANSSENESCNGVNSSVSVTDQWRAGSGGFCSPETIAFVNNSSSQSVDCVVAFHKSGSFDTANASLVTVAPGQKVGGEWGGLWSCGNDSNQVIFSCVTTAQNRANNCLGHVKWQDVTQ